MQPEGRGSDPLLNVAGSISAILASAGGQKRRASILADQIGKVILRPGFQNGDGLVFILR